MLCIWIAVCIAVGLGFRQVDGQTSSNNVSQNYPEPEHHISCPPWFYYNSTTKTCECFHHPAVVVDVVCTETEALLNFGSCMTYDDQEYTTSLGQCNSFLVNSRKVSDGNYIHLPKNLSELNDYMCAPMHRKGLVCSQCIDGFGPAVFSYSFQCANCSGVWYGVPVYLFLEFVPITVFYLFILAFQISVTGAPMTSFVLYGQFAALFLESFVTLRVSIQYEQGEAMYFLFKIVTAFYGVWNLDFIRYILPPFCISPHLKQLHIVTLSYISAIYPIIMIGITLTCIKLYSRNLRPLIWLWNKVKVFSKSKRESKVTIVDVFATFLLLSYTKMMQTSLNILFSTYIVNINNKPKIGIVGIDPSVKYLSKEHIPFAILAFLILLGPVLLPVLILAFYPIRSCRLVLEKCGLRGHTKAALDIFVEKFYSCYRDGLEGGKDMRSLASLYFFLRILVFIIICVQSEIIYFFSLTLIFCATSLMVAIVRPYKKPYMNNIDILVLSTLSLVPVLYILYLYLIPGYSTFMCSALFIVYSLPLIGFSIAMFYLVIKRTPLLKQVKLCLHELRRYSPNGDQYATHNEEADVELPDRIIHEDSYRDT